ncbi:cation:proton antiporter [Streptomyces triticirhizae]|uniref:Cation:proton antiporter n=1 Tax=Streptomyces triticirhizae TaxID=2483353 RepID=A0A3M2LN81_9ACTN|nr:cation:proton antiporter [Streptomyces triticirhizae]RMI36238.1 cation:proton antiporter [Streptomyces triticirhizae]
MSATVETFRGRRRDRDEPRAGEPDRRRRPGPVVVVGVLLVAALALLVPLLWAGERWFSSPQADSGAGGGGHGSDLVLRLLVALPLILGACHVAGRLAARLGQPPVMGEIAAGLALGPSVLGALWPQAAAWLFPAQLLPVLESLGQLGLVCFMFLVGYELDLAALRRSRGATVVVSLAGLLVPFVGGVLLAFPMYRTFAGEHTGFVSFALFLGVALSITAFPVLARVLRDRRMERTPVGAFALACAALGDALAWCLLAVVVAMAAGGGAGGLGAVGVGLGTIALTAAFTAVLFLLVRPLLARLLARPGGVGAAGDASALPVLIVGLLLSAFATEAIGVHPVFGAFLFGLVTPRGTARTERSVAHVEGFAGAVLLPLFFVHTGLQTTFGLLAADWRTVGWFLLALAAAVLTKVVGAVGAARWSGWGRRDSLALGVLMNCRGLTELVVLSLGLNMAIITPAAFALLVLVTLVTTLATAPLLRVLYGRVERSDSAAPAETKVTQ